MLTISVEILTLFIYSEFVEYFMTITLTYLSDKLLTTILLIICLRFLLCRFFFNLEHILFFFILLDFLVCHVLFRTTISSDLEEVSYIG